MIRVIQILSKLIRGSPEQLETDPSMKKYLIVGLGNIGSEYAETRHNIGFKTVDRLADKLEVSFQTLKLGDVATFKVKGRQFILLKPSTYMNLSGQAVTYWMQKENIRLENILVITDDLNLPFGTIRLKTKGSDGGHNGLKDLQDKLGTTNYNRCRFGIGNEFNKGNQVNYVLGQWSEEELQTLPERLDKMSDLAVSFALSGVNHTMNEFNGN